MILEEFLVVTLMLEIVSRVMLLNTEDLTLLDLIMMMRMIKRMSMIIPSFVLQEQLLKKINTFLQRMF